MRITNKQKDLISKRIADKLAKKISDKVIKGIKTKSVAKHPAFIKYRKADDQADVMYEKYQKLREVASKLYDNLGGDIFGVSEDYIDISNSRGTVTANRYSLRRSIEDELHLTELSSLENVDDIIDEVAKLFEIKQ